ncbi:hypothetical protein F441_03220 [Phytophthora nicotianae CJ01A1]|uniref:HTH myb-type domain-containing protein n=3 Tax=Phytophthora nicotianae TaxID=4792 RepID=W2ZXJ3_PHYNI|nr:hypothetical protein L915_03116 [Phytophthora nicotianae]ETP23710.1 hypothetical protein F441_03220 [Phytophthora nicotianae CJ01A1]ETP51676.1 hypothetical protein F442_03216 [Phytophthora nicotianae P10297]
MGSTPTSKFLRQPNASRELHSFDNRLRFEHFKQTSTLPLTKALLMPRITRRKGTQPRLSREGEGVWTPGEHARFLEAVDLYPHGPWKLVAAHIGTRSTRQAMTHAQKYRQKLERRRGLRNAQSKRPKTVTPSWPTSTSESETMFSFELLLMSDDGMLGETLRCLEPFPLMTPHPILYADPVAPAVQPAWVDDCMNFFVANFS